MGRLAKNLAIIGAGSTLFLLSVAVMALIGGFYDAKYPFENEYAIVIDAGSSSSKIYVYSWPEGLKVSLGEAVTITQVSLCTQAPGLDKVTTHDAIYLYFDPCINAARKIIPAQKRNRTYITLGATAGMRLLYSANSALANQIIGYVQDYFNHTEFYFTNSSQVRIITGNEEGQFGWISTNYFLNSFASKKSQIYGILDLGGASTQIGYVPDNANVLAQNTTVQKYFNNIRIYGNEYEVYSSSYLCYGVDQILLVYQAYLIILGNYAAQVDGACFSEGSFMNVTASSIAASNCANGVIFTYPNGINMNTLNSKPFYIINGVSDVAACQQQMSVLFSTTICNYGSCSFNNNYLPDKTGNYFYGFSNYYNAITNTETLSGKALKKDFNTYKNQSDYLCSLNYTDLTALNHNNVIPDRFLRTVCFNNHIVINLLTQFKITNFDNVVITLDINGNTIGWSLGYLFSQINRDDFLPVEQPQRKIPSDFFLPAIIVSGVLTGLILIVLIGFIIYSIYN